jgi:hypothetical protein
MLGRGTFLKYVHLPPGLVIVCAHNDAVFLLSRVGLF